MESAKFTERELKEIFFALTYANGFAHGTDGHNRLMLIAKLAECVGDEYIRGLVEIAKVAKGDAQ